MRSRLYSFDTALIVVGTCSFFRTGRKFAVIGIAGILIFIGQAMIQLLMLMFITDSCGIRRMEVRRAQRFRDVFAPAFIYKMSGVGQRCGSVTLVLQA